MGPRGRLFGIAAFVIVGVAMLSAYGAMVMCACQPPPGPTVPPSPVVGVVTAVDSAGLGNVEGFSVRLTDGSTWGLTLGQLENATEFSPSHLAEHQASSQPVRAFYRVIDGEPTVYRLEDAAP